MLRVIVVSICCILLPASAFAAASGVKAANNQVGVQSISTNVDYIEIGNGRLGTATGTLDTETGPVPGISFYLSAMDDWLFGNDYLRAEYDYSIGHTGYIGSLQGGTYGSVVQNSGATFTDYTLRYGTGFVTGGSSMLTPYIEYGSHEWVRGVNYGETYTHKYYGLGLLRQFSLNRHSVLALNILYGRTGESAIDIKSGPLLTGFSGPLGNSDLYKFGVAIDYAFSQRLHGTLGVDYTAFTYGISAVYPSGTSSIWEPDSRTNYTMLRFGLGESF